MQLSVTFRHMDTTDALKDYAREKVERINKYFPDPIKAHVVLSCDRGYNHTADVVITLHNGILIKGEEVTEDMYSSIDLVMAKIERQVRKYKDKIRSHRPASSSSPSIEMHHSVVELLGEGNGRSAGPEATLGSAAAPLAAAPPQIIKKSKFFARPLSVEEAVMQMNLLGNDFLVFSHAASREVNVVYRRKDGTYGLIETGGRSAAS
ncbi:MAG: ribosome-associated translation inhibitor RaiA [Myxococcales bacterium]|nr:ribosome-associated translation inhibitor RaiA [Myxococcales bacterium]